MTTAIQTTDALWAVVASGDLSRLTPDQKIAYYRSRCEVAGLDYRAQPFQYMRLQGKETLYATKAATDQLAALHGVRVEIVSQSTDDGIRVVTVRAIAKDGRQTDEIGAVSVKGLSGEALCNAMMKAVTKAKRRAVLSLCGLGMMGETEVESIPNAQVVSGEGNVSGAPGRPQGSEAPSPSLPVSEPSPALPIAEAASALGGEVVAVKPLSETGRSGSLRPVNEIINWAVKRYGFKQGREKVASIIGRVPSTPYTDDEVRLLNAHADLQAATEAP